METSPEAAGASAFNLVTIRTGEATTLKEKGFERSKQVTDNGHFKELRTKYDAQQQSTVANLKVRAKSNDSLNISGNIFRNDHRRNSSPLHSGDCDSPPQFDDIENDTAIDSPNTDNYKSSHTEASHPLPTATICEPRKKKTRTVFSRTQIYQLESTFDMKRYLSSSERASLARSLNLTETQVGLYGIVVLHLAQKYKNHSRIFEN